MIVPKMNQILNHSQSEASGLSTHNDNLSQNNNDNEIDTHHDNNNVDSNTTDRVLNQNNYVTAKNNSKNSKEANQISLPLNFYPTTANIERENEDDEVQIVPIAGALKKQLWL